MMASREGFVEEAVTERVHRAHTSFDRVRLVRRWVWFGSSGKTWLSVGILSQLRTTCSVLPG